MLSFTKYIVLFSLVFGMFFFACRDTIKSSEIDFAIKDTSEVSKIIIYNHEDTLELTKQNKKWQLDNFFSVDKKMISRALNTLNLIELNTPLPDEVNEKYFNYLKKNALVVEVYNRKKLIKKLYIGDFVENSGNYILLEGAENPYIAHIPFHLFDLRKNFSLYEKYWRSKEIFNFEPEQIESIYYKDFENKNQFVLTKKDNEFFVCKDSIEKPIIVNTNKVYSYLSYFKNKECVEFKDDIPTKRKKIFLLEIKLKGDKNYNLEAYEYLIDCCHVDKNLFVGVLNSNIYMIAKYYDFDLIRQGNNFFK